MGCIEHTNGQRWITLQEFERFPWTFWLYHARKLGQLRWKWSTYYNNGTRGHYLELLKTQSGGFYFGYGTINSFIFGWNYYYTIQTWSHKLQYISTVQNYCCNVIKLFLHPYQVPPTNLIRLSDSLSLNSIYLPAQSFQSINKQNYLHMMLVSKLCVSN